MRKLLRDIILNILGLLKSPKPGVHIINSHYVTPNLLDYDKDYELFENYLKYLTDIGELLSIDNAIDQVTNKKFSKNKTQFVLTFDDGFEECYTVIAPLLEKYNCKGVFFINTNYINSDLSYQDEFNKRIHLTTKTPMSWIQVIDLHKRGHTIGSHTLDHYNLSELSIKNIENQIRRNKVILEEKLNYKCDYFAWTYGRMNDFPNLALLEAEKYHKYIFSSANYKKYFSKNNRIINRRHLEPFWPKSQINYFLSSKKQ